MLAGVADEVVDAGDHVASVGGAGDCDAAAAPELEHPLVAEEAQRAQHGVRVDAEDGREVPGGRQTLARLRLAVGDRAPDLCRDLLEELGRLLLIDLDFEHRAVHTITK